MSILILARCGEIAWHSENRFAGRVDLVLTPHGLLQAHELVKIVDKHRPELIFSSPLKRAKQVTELIENRTDTTYKPQIRYSDELTARSFGALQGLTYADARRLFEEQNVKKWAADEAAPGGESMADVQKRTGQYYEQNVKPHTDKNENVLLLTHASCLQALTRYLKLPLPVGTVAGTALIYEKEGNQFKLQNQSNEQTDPYPTA